MDNNSDDSFLSNPKGMYCVAEYMHNILFKCHDWKTSHCDVV